MSLESTAPDSTGFGLVKMNVGGPKYAVLCKKVSKSGLKKKKGQSSFSRQTKMCFNEHGAAGKQTVCLGANNKRHVEFGNLPPEPFSA